MPARTIYLGPYSHPAIPYAKTYRGKRGVGEFFAAIAEIWIIKDFSPENFLLPVIKYL